MNKENRLLELDALRGIAALGVVIFHYAVAFKDQYSYGVDILPVFRYFRYGKHGVELFFLISGFVILMSLGRTRNGSDFVFARFSRLYPAYWVAIVISFIVVTIANFPDLRIDYRDALINLTMFQQFLNVPNIDGNYWTLGLELSFYIIMLVLFMARLLKRIDAVAIGWLLVMLAGFLLEKTSVLVLDPRIKVLLVIEHAHLFIIGMMFYEVHTKGFSAKKCLIIAACLLFSLLKHGWEPTLFVAAFVAAFTLILKGYLVFINVKPLLFLGTISYSLYLNHLNFGLVAIKGLERVGLNINLAILITLVLTIVLAAAVTFYVEKPILNFMKSQRKAFLLRRDN